jgi:hypothetical protein
MFQLEQVFRQIFLSCKFKVIYNSNSYAAHKTKLFKFHALLFQFLLYLESSKNQFSFTIFIYEGIICFHLSYLLLEFIS